jgi:uncharacterized protein YndB with AHSA1/START domain
MGQLRVEATGVTSADPETVWSLVADANSYPHWGPWNDGGYRPPATGTARTGQVRWFRYGRWTVTVEETLEVDAPRRLVYTVVKGIPVRNYRAEVTLTPAPPAGTEIHWAAAWDETFLGKMVHRQLRKVYVEVMSALVAAADEQVKKHEGSGLA